MSLQGVSLVDFTGGLNLRRNEFTLAENQSPEMLNVEVSELGGFLTRPGWSRWNANDIVATPTGLNWDPRTAYVHSLSSGEFGVYVSNGTTVYHAPSTTAVFSDLSITVGGDPHLADFASWGDICYIACGHLNTPRKHTNNTSLGTLTAPGNGTWNDDYTTPAGGYFPRAEYVEAHGGYIFAAYIREDRDGGGTQNYPNRLRWSHPNEAEDWAELDFLDIKTGGGRITGIKSFQDHLLIFKDDSVWALYGYDNDTWQLIHVTRGSGCPHPGAVSRSPGAVFYYSVSSRPGIYLYAGGGEPEYISNSIHPAFDDLSITDASKVFVAWVSRRLWVSVPWDPEVTGYPGSTFMLDPEVGDGAWVLLRPAAGKLNAIIEESDVVTDSPLAVIHGDSGAAAVMELDRDFDSAVDFIDQGDLTGSGFPAYYRTPWVFAGTPEARKSWRRPRFICGTVFSDVTLDVCVLHDYNETNVVETQSIDLTAPTGFTLWNSSTWNGGTWGEAPTGSVVTRSTQGNGLGVTKAVSLKFVTNSGSQGTPWSVAGIEMKYKRRRYTT